MKSNKQLNEKRKQGIFNSKKYLKRVQPFFSGDLLQQRMKKIRYQFIEPIRASYSKQSFQLNRQKLKKLVQGDQEITKMLQKIRYKTWNEKVNKQTSFYLIQLLKNQSWCTNITSLINKIFRQTEINQQKCQIAVTLIESINIQLYLFLEANPQLQSFKGIVYRGIYLTSQELNKFKQIFKEKQVQKRVFCFPLNIVSTSKDIDVAKSFWNVRQGQKKILFKIHIISPDQLDQRQYYESFNSIITTIAAVDISSIKSQYQEEEQVVLRGPFILALQIEDLEQDNQKYTLIQGVMNNTCRDHISTNHIGIKSELARQFYRTICQMSQWKFAQNFQFIKQTGNTNKVHFELMNKQNNLKHKKLRQKIKMTENQLKS